MRHGRLPDALTHCCAPPQPQLLSTKPGTLAPPQGPHVENLQGIFLNTVLHMKRWNLSA